MEPSIEINDDLIVKWEPKVQKLASSVFVLDMDRDDIAQELRISILKAAKGFNPQLGTTCRYTKYRRHVRSRHR
mgnify:CR=1 FL=1